MNKKTRLLMGITLSEVGGSQKVVYDILSRLPEDSYDMTLVTAPGGELLDWVDALNREKTNKIRVVTMDCIRRDFSPFYDLITLFKLVSLIRGGRYDVAHFHNSKMGTLGRLASKLCGIPKIYYTMHGLNLNKNTTGRLYPLLSLIERWIARFTTKVIFVSKHDMEVGLRNGWASEENSCLIYNGVSEVGITEGKEMKQSTVPGQAPIIIFVARLAEPKQPEFAIRVSAKLLRDGYDHKLMIVGDGPKMALCRDLIRSLGAEDRIIMTGKCNNVMELLSQADIFCLFSKWEGLPISVIEAMVCGLPIVASNVGGIPELVEHGVTGFLVPGQDVEITAGYLKALICNIEKRKIYSNMVQIDARSKFNLENMISQYHLLYLN